MYSVAALAGVVLFVALAALVVWVFVRLLWVGGLGDLVVSREWLKERAQLEVRTVAELEHQLVIDGEVALTSTDEGVVLAVRREIESLR